MTDDTRLEPFAEVHWQGRFFVLRGWVVQDRGEKVLVRRYRDDPYGDVWVRRDQLRRGLGWDFEAAAMTEEQR